MQKRGLTLVLSFMCLAAPVAGATFWVEPPPAGSDANAGTSAQPWATLQHAADQVAAGDTVRVRAGTYAGFHLTTSGTSGAAITFRADAGAVPRVVGDNAVTPDAINLEGASFVVIDGFRVESATRAGIRAVLCEQVTIRRNHCAANGRWGIFTGFCDDLLIEDNETTGSVLEHGIYTSNSGDRPVIRRNRIWSNHANGIHMNGDISQGGDGVITDALVEANVIWDNGAGGGSGINMDGVQDSLVRNNLIYDSHASGISVFRQDGGAASNGNRILNNTVVVAGDGRWALNIQNASTGTIVRNNTLWSDHGFRGAMSVCTGCLAGLVSDHNAVEDRFTLDDGDSVLDLAAWRLATGQDQQSFVAAPAALFADPAGGDFHLETASPALDTGLALPAEVPFDLEATPRPLGAGWDIGAFEGTGIVFADGFESGDPSAWSAIVE